MKKWVQRRYAGYLTSKALRRLNQWQSYTSYRLCTTMWPVGLLPLDRFLPILLGLLACVQDRDVRKTWFYTVQDKSICTVIGGGYESVAIAYRAAVDRKSV